MTEYPIFLHCTLCARATKHLLRHDDEGTATELECTGCRHMLAAGGQGESEDKAKAAAVCGWPRYGEHEL